MSIEMEKQGKNHKNSTNEKNLNRKIENNIKI